LIFSKKVNLSEEKVLKMPSYKGFHGFVFGQTELVVQTGRAAVTFLSPLPKLAGIIALKHYPIFL
jgi:hypothetical protein